MFYYHDCAGCAFVKYETKDQAVAAIEGLNGNHKMEVVLLFFTFFFYR